MDVEGRGTEDLINWRHIHVNSSPSTRSSLRLWAILFLLFVIGPLVFLLITHSTFSFSVFTLKMTRPTSPQRVLRVMTFNIWISGERVHNGLEKIANQIKVIDPDIVAIQELQTAEVGKNLTTLLGESKWSLIHHSLASYPDTAIITKHKFVSEPIGLQFKRDISDFLFHEELYANHSTITYGIGVSIEIDNDQRINVFSMHLDYKSYGPYAADNKLVVSAKQIMAGERNKQGYGRAQNIEQLIANDGFSQFMKLSETEPFIIAGDFNSPSHLDWTGETKDIHGGWTFEWPSTKLLMDTDFLDSYRQIHPNVIDKPGHTWSTVQKSTGPEWDWNIPEPQDRIDFIFYKPSPMFRPIRSYIYAGEGPLKPIPNHWDNEWPSDHYAVITEFSVDLLNENEKGDQMLMNGVTKDGFVENMMPEEGYSADRSTIE